MSPAERTCREYGWRHGSELDNDRWCDLAVSFAGVYPVEWDHYCAALGRGNFTFFDAVAGEWGEPPPDDLGEAEQWQWLADTRGIEVFDDNFRLPLVDDWALRSLLLKLRQHISDYCRLNSKPLAEARFTVMEDVYAHGRSEVAMLHSDRSPLWPSHPEHGEVSRLLEARGFEIRRSVPGKNLITTSIEKTNG